MQLASYLMRSARAHMSPWRSKQTSDDQFLRVSTPAGAVVRRFSVMRSPYVAPSYRDHLLLLDLSSLLSCAKVTVTLTDPAV